MGERFEKIEGGGARLKDEVRTRDKELLEAWAVVDVGLKAEMDFPEDSYEMSVPERIFDAIRSSDIFNSPAFFSFKRRVREIKDVAGACFFAGAEVLVFIMALPFALMGCESSRPPCPDECEHHLCHEDEKKEIVCGCPAGEEIVKCDYGEIYCCEPIVPPDCTGHPMCP